MQRESRAAARGLRVAAVALSLVSGLAACSSAGTVRTADKREASSPVGSATPSLTPTASPTPTVSVTPSPTHTATPDTTVSKEEAANVLKAYEAGNNAANASVDTAAISKLESGALLSRDQTGYVYALGVGGDRLKQLKQPIALVDPAFYISHSTAYPRGFFVTLRSVQSGVADSDWLMHFAQSAPGAPWLADDQAMLVSGKQWPEFAVAPDGFLDDTAVQRDKLAMNPLDLVAADRTMLADNNAGQPASPFLNDEVTAAEERWIQQENDSVAPATVALTVTTDLGPPPLTMPLKNGGELVLWGSRLSLRVSEPGHTFPFTDQGYAKIAGRDSFHDAFTADSVYSVAAVDPADKGAKFEKIAQNGGLVSLR